MQDSDIGEHGVANVTVQKMVEQKGIEPSTSRLRT